MRFQTCAQTFGRHVLCVFVFELLVITCFIALLLCSTHGHHVCGVLTLVLNSLSSCFLFLCFPHGRHVICGPTLVLELLVVVFLLVLLGRLNC